MVSLKKSLKRGWTKLKKLKKNPNLIIVIISVLFIVLIYLVIHLVRFFKAPADTVMIKNGELINYEEVVGYIIRDEEVVDTSMYTGQSKATVEDATRVAKSTTILTYISAEAEQIKTKIEKLDEKIGKAMDSRQTIFSNDAKALDSEIELYLYSSMQKSTDVYETAEKKELLNEKIEKKAKIVGDLSPVGSQIKSLIEERTEYEKELNDSQKSVKASSAGLVSYRIDGYENMFTMESLSKLSSEELNKLKITTNQVIPINTNKVKLVNNFECYIAVPISSKESENAKLNDTVYLRLDDSSDDFISATVEYISEEENGRIIVFKIKTNVEELTKYRKIMLDVVWWRDEGLKVNKSAINQTQVLLPSGRQVTIPTVTIKKANYTQEAYVKVIREAGDFAIIDNYKDNELSELGLTENMIENRSTIKMYDEVIISH